MVTSKVGLSGLAPSSVFPCHTQTKCLLLCRSITVEFQGERVCATEIWSILLAGVKRRGDLANAALIKGPPTLVLVAHGSFYIYPSRVVPQTTDS